MEAPTQLVWNGSNSETHVGHEGYVWAIMGSVMGYCMGWLWVTVCDSYGYRYVIVWLPYGYRYITQWLPRWDYPMGSCMGSTPAQHRAAPSRGRSGMAHEVAPRRALEAAHRADLPRVIARRGVERAPNGSCRKFI